MILLVCKKAKLLIGVFSFLGGENAGFLQQKCETGVCSGSQKQGDEGRGKLFFQKARTVHYSKVPCSCLNFF